MNELTPPQRVLSLSMTYSFNTGDPGRGIPVARDRPRSPSWSTTDYVSDIKLRQLGILGHVRSKHALGCILFPASAF